MTTDTDALLTTKQVAKKLGLSYYTIMTWRSVKRYPLKYIKVGRRIRYRLSDVEAFLRERTESA